MELLKKTIPMMHEKNRSVTQVTLEEDCNVPDLQPDVGKMIWHNASVKIEDIQAGTDKVTILGQLVVFVLYISDTPEHRIHRLETKVPFREVQNVTGAVMSDEVHLSWETEDVTVSLINSRKISVKALLSFTTYMEESYDVSAAVELHGTEEVSIRTRKIELLKNAVQKKDILRIKDEITVPSGKPNIGSVLWENIQLRGTDVRVLDGQLDVKGELFVFILYEGDDENATKQWIETVVPFQGTLECAKCHAAMIPQITTTLAQTDVTVQADYDGERRLLSLEAVLDLDVRLYTEESVEVLEDVYSPVKNLIPVQEEQVYESLLMKNFSKVRASERIRLKANQPRMLQTCTCRGEVKIDEAHLTPEGIAVEGAVSVSVLYVSSDDRIPYAVLTGAVPIQQVIEMNSEGAECRFQLQTGVDQLSVTMIDSEEVEIKVTVNISAFAVKVHREPCMVEVQEEEPDMKTLKELPGIVGYVMGEGERLWDVAKNYHTTPERILALNHMEEQEVQKGSKLVILKTVN